VEPYIVPLIVLALVTTGGYFWGRKKNRWIGAWIARETEAALGPRDTEYVNIGGCIGYHFTYSLQPPSARRRAPSPSCRGIRSYIYPSPSSSDGTIGSSCSSSRMNGCPARRTSCKRTTTKKIRTGSPEPRQCAGIAS